MKTGFICASGFNMVASATRNGRTLIAVVLGADSSTARGELAAQLLNQGFSQFSLGLKPSLATFASRPSPGPTTDLHEFICGGKPKQDSDEGPVLARAAPELALEPRFVLMEPVVVFTGRADPGPGKAVTKEAAAAPAKKGAPAPGIPLPRPRPTYPAGASLAR